MDTSLGRRKRGINWSAVAAFLTVAGWLIMAASGVFGDYREIGQRVKVLETQRDNDVRQMNRMEQKLDRYDDKLDKLLMEIRTK